MAVEWKDEYTVGDARIDAQHQYLFSLAARFDQADLMEGNALIMELFKYTREHFAAEEAHMRQIGFPATPEHTALHENLIEELGTVAERGLESQEDLDALRRFYGKWLTHHILKFDRRYFDYAQGGICLPE